MLNPLRYTRYNQIHKLMQAITFSLTLMFLMAHIEVNYGKNYAQLLMSSIMHIFLELSLTIIHEAVNISFQN